MVEVRFDQFLSNFEYTGVLVFEIDHDDVVAEILSRLSGKYID